MSEITFPCILKEKFTEAGTRAVVEIFEKIMRDRHVVDLEAARRRFEKGLELFSIEAAEKGYFRDV